MRQAQKKNAHLSRSQKFLYVRNMLAFPVIDCGDKSPFPIVI